MPAVTASRTWLGDAFSATLVHGMMVAGLLMMYVFTGTEWPMLWVYLAWSYAYDMLFRPLLWRKFIFDGQPAASAG